jgi:hypothetical protein
MTSSIRAFWRRLEGSVHPDDETVLSTHHHTFNLDYPPPAFIGDVDNAPVIILMANGGYGSRTKEEFPTDIDRKEHLDWLKGFRSDPPKRLSSYYAGSRLFPLVLSGEIVIVNAVAYRSPRISNERENQKIARKLHSWIASQSWLYNEVIPLAKRNERLIITHRNRLWGIKKNNADEIIVSTNPVSENLSCVVSNEIERWLNQRRSLQVNRKPIQ